MADDVRIRASAVCRRGDQLLTVRATDPVTGQRFLFLPGGGVEAGETAVAAAERETREETGYVVRAGAAGAVVRAYTFDWAGRPVACRTTFCPATLVDPAAAAAAVDDADYLHGVEWVDVRRVEAVFAYHPTVLEAVRTVLARAGG